MWVALCAFIVPGALLGRIAPAYLKGILMVLAKNRHGVQELLKELEPLILGRELKGSSCGCGEVVSHTAIADKIVPAGDSYVGQETKWFLWTVHMNTPGEEPDWSCGLSQFIKVEILEAMFNRYFGNDDDDENDQSYRLEVEGSDRVDSNLSAAVRISENDDQIRFSIDWGREQSVARRINEVYSVSPHRIPAGSGTYGEIVSILDTIQPEVYRGGPDPELAFESAWHLDYDTALAQASAAGNHIFFQNMGVRYDHRGETRSDTDIVFMKHAVK